MSKLLIAVRPVPERSWPFLESEMRNHFLSIPEARFSRAADEDGRGVPYSTRDLPTWQIRIIDQFPLLYRYPDAGRVDFCHLAGGFTCGPEWAHMISDLSETAEVLVRALRTSVQADTRVEVTRVTVENGMLRWRLNTNLSAPFLEFLRDLLRE